ncbi:DUF6176 family protein [Microbacterium imperiale]|uniref:DUF6176 family protein n=1 Tax=Microbacterium imperiale TaxID=33884 RepID=UPI001AE5EA7F|nr:DUF6176 family protein [Microbacterium imperiale]MBP2420155.1 hypothetical protein [Microbacterium imperiale]MDS0197982.1 hypothetical protein [Microbacterium imperiale]
MIHLVTRRIRLEERDRLIAWLAQVDGPRRAEALASLAAEGVEHERALLLDTSDGPVIVYAMQTDDLDAARRVTDSSPRPIDAEHRDVMRAVDAGPADAVTVLDLHP